MDASIKTRKIRIHGDNIVECERTLKMLSEALGSQYTPLDSPLYFPKYSILTNNCIYSIELLSGHARWSGIDLGAIIHTFGRKLRETADAYITEIADNQENVLLAIEYCSALPAGNNAWQRNGRALANVFANVPYLYYAEIGGIELAENRQPKAPRYPNPAVPFSYISISKDMDTYCLPIYRAHPTITAHNFEKYQDCLGYDDGLTFIKHLLEGKEVSSISENITEKALRLVKTLAQGRRHQDTLNGEEWEDLLKSRNRAHWLATKSHSEWTKRFSEKVAISDSFKELREEVLKLDTKSIVAKDLPFCIIPQYNIDLFANWLHTHYPNIAFHLPHNKDLAIVWITGFKPKGDDSRPDRGLAPLCRMILGQNAVIMAIVSGPAQPHTWSLLEYNPQELCNSNGLFQAIFACCNYLLVDSRTCNKAIFLKTNASFQKNSTPVSFPYIDKITVDFSEHDIDCAIHQIFSAKEHLNIHECFCNSPGGDWSGIDFFHANKVYKWTSLPRVLKHYKRPDHLFQIGINNKWIFVTIESKGLGHNLEDAIGNRLKDYIQYLFNSVPTAYRPNQHSDWRFFDGKFDHADYSIVAVGAFLYKDDEELENHLKRGDLDAIFAFDFGETSTLHYFGNQSAHFLIDYLTEIASEQGNFIVKIH